VCRHSLARWGSAQAAALVEAGAGARQQQCGEADAFHVEGPLGIVCAVLNVDLRDSGQAAERAERNNDLRPLIRWCIYVDGWLDVVAAAHLCDDLELASAARAAVYPEDNRCARASRDAHVVLHRQCAVAGSDRRANREAAGVDWQQRSLGKVVCPIP